MVANSCWTDGNYVVANSIWMTVWMEGIRVIMWIQLSRSYCQQEGYVTACICYMDDFADGNIFHHQGYCYQLFNAR